MDQHLIETERLLLRRLNSEDTKDILTIYGDEETVRFKPMFPLKNEKEAAAYLSALMEDYEEAYSCLYGICLKNVPDTLIGCIRVETKAPYDFGYTVLRDLWNQGIATEAGRAVLDRIREEGVLPYVTATHDRDNPASGKVMEHLGMRYGYSYFEQWQPKDIPVIFRMYQLNFTAGKTWLYDGYRKTQVRDDF